MSMGGEIPCLQSPEGLQETDQVNQNNQQSDYELNQGNDNQAVIEMNSIGGAGSVHNNTTGEVHQE